MAAHSVQKKSDDDLRPFLFPIYSSLFITQVARNVKTNLTKKKDKYLNYHHPHV